MIDKMVNENNRSVLEKIQTIADLAERARDDMMELGSTWSWRRLWLW